MSLIIESRIDDPKIATNQKLSATMDCFWTSKASNFKFYDFYDNLIGRSSDALDDQTFEIQILNLMFHWFANREGADKGFR